MLWLMSDNRKHDIMLGEWGLDPDFLSSDPALSCTSYVTLFKLLNLSEVL